jgi:hypothetical protein
MSSLERKVLYFPNRTVAGEIVAFGIPGPFAQGSAIWAPWDVTYGSSTGGATENAAAVRIDLPKKPGSEGAVRAICIAPDSAIHTCDIALHGNGGELSRHRISPGNPLLSAADHEADYALVTIINSIPQITLGSRAAGAAEAFDRTIMGQNDNEDVIAFPLRLEVWRGALPPMRTHQRAGYAGNAVGRFADGTTETDVPRTFYFCTDGRRRIGVTSMIPNGVGTHTIQCFSVEAHKNPSDPDIDARTETTMVLDDIGSTSLTVSGAAPASIAFDGIAPTVLKIVLTGSSHEEFDLRVKAED